MLEHEDFGDILAVIDVLLPDSDKFKQRAAAEILAGVLRGQSIHWQSARPESQL